MKIGFIGLGSQGASMADMTRKAGFDLSVWARREAVRADYRNGGFTVVDDVLDLADTTDAICLCVTGDDDVLGVVHGGGLLGAMQSGSVLVIHSTVSPQTCEQLARSAAPLGISVLDAPVSGGGDAACDGRLLVMVGGDEQALRQVHPVLSSYGDPVLHVGDVGDGQRVKIVNNLACIGNMAVADLALRLGESAGLRRQILTDALSNGSGRSFALDVFAHVARRGAAGHAAALFEKDARLGAALAADSSFPIGVLEELAVSIVGSLEGLES